VIPLDPDELVAAANEVHAALDGRRRVVFSLFLAAAPRLWRQGDDGLVLDLAAVVRSGLAAEPHEVFDAIISSMYERAHRPGPWPYGAAVRGWLVWHGYGAPELNSQVPSRILEV
jgi:hypothetical protein